jgi:hypothetical protein
MHRHGTKPSLEVCFLRQLNFLQSENFISKKVTSRKILPQVRKLKDTGNPLDLQTFSPDQTY